MLILLILCQSEFSNFFFFQNRKSSWCHLYWLWTKLEDLRGLCWSGLDIYDCQFSAENIAQELSPSSGRQLDPRVCFGTCFRLHLIFWEPHGPPALNKKLSLSGSIHAVGEGGAFSLRTSVASSVFLMEWREHLSETSLLQEAIVNENPPYLVIDQPNDPIICLFCNSVCMTLFRQMVKI